MDTPELAKIVNRSGFLFQWAVEEHVRATNNIHHWQVVAREYPWAPVDGTRGGFIDFVADRFGLHCVFECKRTQGGQWIFLVAEDEQPDLQLRTLWSYKFAGGGQELGWGDLHFEPAMMRSDFCTVRGASDDDRPMLERIASDLVRASESLARDEADTLRRSEGSIAAFIPGDQCRSVRLSRQSSGSQPFVRCASRQRYVRSGDSHQVSKGDGHRYSTTRWWSPNAE
jgi:hypothetical protein